MEDEDTQQELLEHARRQTDALSNIQSAVIGLLALAILAGLIAVAVLIHNN